MLIQDVLNNIEERRNRLYLGCINCIPSPFKRFHNDFNGIEQGCYTIITSSTKGAKTQFASEVFIFHPLLYCYYNKDINVDYKVLYFPLEETPERITQRFISWLLFKHTNGEIMVSPKELRSTTKPLKENILEIIKSDEIQDILKFFEEHVIFIQEGNPTGIYKACKQYAEEHGKVITKKGKYKDEWGVLQETDVFDRYIPDNPNEYVIPFIDTLNLIDTERGMTLKQSMDKMSEYCAKYLRNRYNMSPLIIQQQAFSGEGMDAFKLNKLAPSLADLGESKVSSRDCDIVLGIFSPFRYELAEYYGYDIKKFKDNIRFLSVIINRNGELGGVCPLLFLGNVCSFTELPKPNNTNEINKVYSYLNTIRNGDKISLSFFMHGIINKVNSLFNRK